MGYYWAEFREIKGNLFRFDTRIYLHSVDRISSDDVCIGAVVGKNPGSAMPANGGLTGIQEISLDGDQLLPNVRSIFLKAYEEADKYVPKNAYIQVLNLMYICDKNPKHAIKKCKIMIQINLSAQLKRRSLASYGMFGVLRIKV